MTRFSNHLQAYLDQIGQPIQTTAHLGGEPRKSAPTISPDAAKAAYERLEALVTQDRRDNMVIIRVILVLSVLWFLLGAWLIVQMRDQLEYVFGFFGGQVAGLGVAMAFLGCLWRQKSAMENLLLILPELPEAERGAIVKAFLLDANSGNCLFGR